jgi:hypothetical protein
LVRGSVRECTSDSLLQHCAHVWLIWALFCYSSITHTADLYNIDFRAVWWFVDEGAALKKARGHITISRLPSLKAHACMHVPAIDRIG